MDPDRPFYVPAPQVNQRTGIPTKKVYDLAKRGLIRTRRLPGTRTQYCLQDAERLASEAAAPAAG